MSYYVHFSDYSCAPPSELLLGARHYLVITYHYSPFVSPQVHHQPAQLTK